MFRRFIILVSLSLISLVLWGINLKYTDLDLDKLFYTFFALSIVYSFFQFFLEGIVVKRISDSKTRYSLRKTLYILFIIVVSVIVLRIWIVNPQALLVAYGLVAAGVAISLQDVFKNFAGALTIFITSIYRVGDRIEINSKFGDVIDIGLFYTTLLEMGEWVNGDQATGRIVLIPNGYVLSSTLHNYTKDHDFIWDEINIPITYDSDWKNAVDIIQSFVKDKTSVSTNLAQKEILKLEEKYYLSRRNIEPMVFVVPTDNWIMLSIRYVSSTRERRLIRNDLFKSILIKIQASKNIKIASQTISIVDFPEGKAI